MLGRADVLLQIAAPLGARDRHDVLALRQHPGERQLPGVQPLRRRDRLDPRHEVEVLLEVLALEARRLPAPVVGLEIVGRADLAGQEARPSGL